MRKALLLVLLGSLLGAPTARALEPVVLLPATGANVGPSELTAATDLLRAALERTGRYQVLLSPRPSGGLEPTPAEAGQEARSLGATLAVTLRLSRLGSGTTARLAAYDAEGRTRHTDDLAAANASDLDPVLGRLAQGLADGRRASGPAQVGTVSRREAQVGTATQREAQVGTVAEREAAPPLRRAATTGIGLKLGVQFLVDRPGTSTNTTATGLGLSWLHDAGPVLAELFLEGAAGSGDWLTSAGLGAYFPLGSDNIAPYLGGGVSAMLARVRDGTGGGLAFRGAGGLLVNRLSTLQFRFEAGYQSAAFTVHAHGHRARPQGPFLWGAVIF